MTISANDLDALAAKLAEGAPVPEDDLLALAASTDILTLGMLADDSRRRRHGAHVTYVRVAEIGLPLGAHGVAIPPAAGEVRVSGDVSGLDSHLAALGLIVAAAGAVPVTAFSLADLEGAARSAGRDLGRVCASLREAGVSAVADAPIDLLVDAEAAFGAVRSAGLEIARVTVARNADAAGRMTLLRRVVELQRTVGGVRHFAPLARRWNPAAPSTGYEDVRHVALARLLAAGIPSIQVDWSLYGPKLAQVALTMGADDLDGVSAVDDAPDGRRRAPLEEVLRNIRAAAMTPVERDGLGRRVGV